MDANYRDEVLSGDVSVFHCAASLEHTMGNYRGQFIGMRPPPSTSLPHSGINQLQVTVGVLWWALVIWAPRLAHRLCISRVSLHSEHRVIKDDLHRFELDDALRIL
jgi:hypothetical protein